MNVLQKKRPSKQVNNRLAFHPITTHSNGQQKRLSKNRVIHQKRGKQMRQRAVPNKILVRRRFGLFDVLFSGRFFFLLAWIGPRTFVCLEIAPAKTMENAWLNGAFPAIFWPLPSAEEGASQTSPASAHHSIRPVNRRVTLTTTIQLLCLGTDVGAFHFSLLPGAHQRPLASHLLSL